MVSKKYTLKELAELEVEELEVLDCRVKQAAVHARIRRIRGKLDGMPEELRMGLDRFLKDLISEVMDPDILMRGLKSIESLTDYLLRKHPAEDSPGD